MFTLQWRVGLWSLIVSCPGHTHFFDQTHKTFRHLALTFIFVGIALHSSDLIVKSVIKTTSLFADIINPLSTIGFRNSILANSADPDAAFDQHLHCLLRQKQSLVKE